MSLTITERDLDPKEYARIIAGFEAHAIERGQPLRPQVRHGFVATDGAELIATVTGLTDQRWFRITDLFVEKPHRRRGIGSLLLERLEALVRAAGIRSICLDRRVRGAGLLPEARLRGLRRPRRLLRSRRCPDRAQEVARLRLRGSSGADRRRLYSGGHHGVHAWAWAWRRRYGSLPVPDQPLRFGRVFSRGAPRSPCLFRLARGPLRRRRVRRRSVRVDASALGGCPSRAGRAAASNLAGPVLLLAVTCRRSRRWPSRLPNHRVRQPRNVPASGLQ